MRLYSQAAFTLIELIAVLVIMGILATTVLIRVTPGDGNLQAAKNDVLAGLVFARETAMARSDGESSVTFAITNTTTETTIDVQVNDASINNINQSYPLILSGDVIITSTVSQILFTNLGETAEQAIVLEDDDRSLTINVSGVGYAY
jgi:MSHA pilin protein MshC